MSKRKPKKEEELPPPVVLPPPPPPGSRRAWLRAALVLALIAGVLGAILAVADWAKPTAADDPRYRMTLGEVGVEAPPGMDRDEFLEEVRYQASWADPFSAATPGIADQLAQAFARHPKVARVGQVRITGPKTIRVELEFK